MRRLRGREGNNAPSSSYCLNAGSIVRVKSKNCHDTYQKGVRRQRRNMPQESLGRRECGRTRFHESFETARPPFSVRKLIHIARCSCGNDEAGSSGIRRFHSSCAISNSIKGGAPFLVSSANSSRHKESRAESTHASSFALRSWHSRTQRCRLFGTSLASRVVSEGRRPAPFVAPANPPCPSTQSIAISSEFLAPVAIVPGEKKKERAGKRTRSPAMPRPIPASRTAPSSALS